MWAPEVSRAVLEDGAEVGRAGGGCAKALGQRGVGLFGKEQEQGGCNGEMEGRHRVGGGGRHCWG